MPAGVKFAINSVVVAAPDEDVWMNVVLGDALAGTERRSPYKVLEWRKQIAGPCDLDWFDYDNRILDSLTTRSFAHLDEYETYTDAICKSVTIRNRRSVGNEVVATFLVYVGV